MRVHFIEPLEPDDAARLPRLLEPGIEVSVGRPIADPADVEIIVGGAVLSGALAPEDFDQLTKLRAVIVPFAGIPAKVAAALRERPDVAVHNLHHNAAATAEMAIGLLLAAARSIVPKDRALRAGDWTPRHDAALQVQLDGRTALVLGLGEIGRRVVRALRALGLATIGIRRRPALSDREDPAFAPDEVHGPDTLAALLPRAEVLVVTLPATPETRGLIGAGELALLPPRAVLVNVGRGPVVDERALYEALRDRRLHGAGLDVWYRYPKGEAEERATPPAALPFHELENVVLSPHCGGMAGVPELEARRLAALADLLNAAARGAPIPNRVDLDLGY